MAHVETNPQRYQDGPTAGKLLADRHRLQMIQAELCKPIHGDSTEELAGLIEKFAGPQPAFDTLHRAKLAERLTVQAATQAAIDGVEAELARMGRH